MRDQQTYQDVSREGISREARTRSSYSGIFCSCEGSDERTGPTIKARRAGDSLLSYRTGTSER